MTTTAGPAATLDGQPHTQAMGGFIDSVGNGITGLVAGAFSAIGAALRGIVNAGHQLLPGGLLWVVVFLVLVATAWTLAKR